MIALHYYIIIHLILKVIDPLSSILKSFSKWLGQLLVNDVKIGLIIQLFARIFHDKLGNKHLAIFLSYISDGPVSSKYHIDYLSFLQLEFTLNTVLIEVYQRKLPNS